jgi:L-seryl-tRNA(Ser) seleniumtransferase
LLRVHRSNFRLEGFVAEVAPRELVALGRRAGVPVAEDLGSGALTDLRAYGLPPERTAGDAVAEGFDLVAFSGDKLLGGPQAGIIAGRRAPIARLAANPLLRALRVGSTTLAALGATLVLHRDAATRERIPLYAMLAASVDALRARATALAGRLPALDLGVVAHDAFTGGGTLPMATLPSVALAWRTPRGGAAAGAARLRAGEPAVIAHVEDERVLIDLRTIVPRDDDRLAAALEQAG